MHAPPATLLAACAPRQAQRAALGRLARPASSAALPLRPAFPAVLKASAQEMKDARLDVAFRDYCGHLLIPLNQCRHKTYFMPFKCTDERHKYEECQYYE